MLCSRYERYAERASTCRVLGARTPDYSRAGRMQDSDAAYITFETAIIECYHRRECSVKVEDIADSLWGSRVSPSTISDLNQKIFERVETWRKRSLEKEPLFLLTGLGSSVSGRGEVATVSVQVAIGPNKEGYQEVLGVAEGSSRRIKKAGANFFVI